jgi:PTS system cellobiose-specific IIC component
MASAKSQAFSEKLSAFTGKIQGNPYIQSITTGLMESMGILIAGTIINIIVTLPIPGWADLLAKANLYDFMTQVVKVFQATAPISAFLIAYHVTEKKGCLAIQGGIAAFMAYMLAVPVAFDEAGNGSIALTSLQMENIATAIIIGLLVPVLYCWAVKKNFVIKLPDSVPPFVSESLGSIPAACIVMFPVLLLRWLLSMTSFATIPGLITAIISTPLSFVGNTLGGHIIFMILNSLVWWFGVHNAPVATAAMVVMTPAVQENVNAVMSGMAAPNDLSLMSWFSIMQLIGGTGMTLGLVLDMAVFARSKRYKAQTKIMLIPSLFCINEPVLFGMPVIMNPTFFIPFVFGPSVVYILFYIGLKMGFYTTPISMASMNLPGFIQGFLQGGGVGFGIFMIVATLIACLIYLPFVKIADNQALKEEKEAVEA